MARRSRPEINHHSGDDQLTKATQRAGRWHDWWSDLPTMDAALSGFNLGTVLVFGSGLFVIATFYFGTRGGYYNTDKYDGNGTAH